MNGPPAVRSKLVPPWYWYKHRKSDHIKEESKASAFQYQSKRVLIIVIANHVIVNIWSSALYETSNCKSQIFHWSLVNWTPKFSEPANDMNMMSKEKSKHVYCRNMEAKTLPSTPSLSPHLWFVWFVGFEKITVKTIACVYLLTFP